MHHYYNDISTVSSRVICYCFIQIYIFKGDLNYVIYLYNVKYIRSIQTSYNTFSFRLNDISWISGVKVSERIEIRDRVIIRIMIKVRGRVRDMISVTIGLGLG